MQNYSYVMPRPPTPAASASNLGLVRKTAGKVMANMDNPQDETANPLWHATNMWRLSIP